MGSRKSPSSIKLEVTTKVAILSIAGARITGQLDGKRNEPTKQLVRTSEVTYRAFKTTVSPGTSSPVEGSTAGTKQLIGGRVASANSRIAVSNAGQACGAGHLCCDDELVGQ
jgi:hypothetical protein